MSGKLFLVPTPLDFGSATQSPLDQVLPFRTIQVAASLACWVCENAKSTRAFLKRIEQIVPLSMPLQQLDLQQLPHEAGNRAVPPNPAASAAMLRPALDGKDMGLISEAGMPAVADPGQGIVRAAHDLAIEVVPLVGPVSMLLALACSGLNGQNFAFVGYLPVPVAERVRRIRELEATALKTGQTQQFIEVPYRNGAMLASLLDVLMPATRLSLACGLTLAQQQIRSDTLVNWKRRNFNLPLELPTIFSIGP